MKHWTDAVFWLLMGTLLMLAFGKWVFGWGSRSVQHRRAGRLRQESWLNHEHWTRALMVVVAVFGAWVNRRLPWYDIVSWSGIYAMLTLGFIESIFDRKTPPVVRAPLPPPSRPRAGRPRCYLVVHLDLKVSPPVALFVHTYSSSARDLTNTGAPEARADLYMIEADTFQEALDEMQRVQPLYFPWVTPLLTRKR